MAMLLTSGYQVAAPMNDAVKRTSASGTSVPMTMIVSYKPPKAGTIMDLYDLARTKPCGSCN
jgi:hypothetical protein